jgi:hypothetical protein
MALIFRYLNDFKFGTLTSAASESSTSLSSTEFSELLTMSSGTTYMPITLLNPSTRSYEMVWISAHSAGSTTCTVSRGQEGTAPLAWPAGTQWISAPTIRDAGVSPGFSSDLLTDAHVGQRSVITDKGETWEQTYAQGWLGTVKANRQDMGRAVDGTTAAPNGHNMMVKAWTVTGTTTAGGLLATAIPNGGFPTRTVSVQITRITAGLSWIPSVQDSSLSKTSVTIYAHSHVSNAALASSPIQACLFAIGY